MRNGISTMDIQSNQINQNTRITYEVGHEISA